MACPRPGGGRGLQTQNLHDIINLQKVSEMESTTNMSSNEFTQAAWPLRRLGLKVLDLSASLDYYTRLGLTVVREQRGEGSKQTVGLGFGSHEVLSLRNECTADFLSFTCCGNCLVSARGTRVPQAQYLATFWEATPLGR